MKKLLIICLLLPYALFGQKSGVYPSLLAGGGVQYSYYAILNSLDRTDKQTVLSPNKLSVSTVAIGGGYRAVRSTIGVSSASAHPLVYFEVLVNFGSAPAIGVANLSFAITGATVSPGFDAGGNSWSYITNGGSPFKGTGGVYTAYGSAYVATDVIMVALDMTNGFIYFGKNGTWLNGGVPTSGATGTGAAFGSLTGTLYPILGCYGGNAFSYTVNFGNTAFTYTVPAGYVGLHH